MATSRTLALAAAAFLAVCGAGDAGDAAESRADAGPRVDLYGDPLPPGAVARMGTVRLPEGGWGRRIAFSPDGEMLASCVGAGSPEAALWETGTGRKIRTIRLRGPASINSVDFSPDGRWLAVAGDKVRIYDVRTARKAREIDGRTLAAFLPDGKRLVSWSGDYDGICLWDLASGKKLRSLPGPVHDTPSLAVSRNGSVLAAVGKDTLHLWDLAAGRELHRIACHGRWTRAMAISPDGKTVATGSDEREISLVDVSTGTQLRVLRGHEHNIYSLDFSPDGNTLASAGFEDKTARLWDVATGRELLMLRHRRAVQAVAFSPDGKTLASSGGGIRLWDVATGRELLPETGGGRIRSIAFSPDGGTLATAHAGRTVHLWEARTGRVLSTFHGHTAPVSCVAFSPDGTKLASGGRDGTVRVWDVASRRELRSLEGCAAWSRGVAFSPDGGSLAAAGGMRRSSPGLWDVATGEKLLDFGEGPVSVRGLAFSPGGGLVAGAGGRDRTVHLWSVVTGAEIAKFVAPGRRAKLRCVAFSPDGRRIAAAGHDSMIRVWDVAPGEHVHPEEGRATNIGVFIVRPDGTGGVVRRERPFEVWEGNVTSIAFSPDGRTLASGSVDRLVRLWDAETGDELAALRGHAGSVEAVAFSADGTLLGSGCSDGTALVWDLAALPGLPPDDF